MHNRIVILKQASWKVFLHYSPASIASNQVVIPLKF